MKNFLFLIAIISIGKVNAQYCTSTATSNADEEIYNVTLGSLNNTTTCGSTGCGAGSVQQMYSNFKTCVTAPALIAGLTYPFSATIGTCGGNFSTNFKAFIDYNRNNVFTDAGETVYSSTTFTSNAAGVVGTGNITIPLTATPGASVLRVVAVETSLIANVTPCGTYTWGETEDYAVTLLQPFNNNAMAMSFISPNNQECLTANTKIEFTIMNGGMVTQDSIKVGIKITGANTRNYEMVVMGPFAPGQSQNVVYYNADLSGYGINTIKVFTSLPLDEKVSDDTITVIRTCAAPTPLPYKQDFEAGGTPAGFTGTMLYNSTLPPMHGKTASKGMYTNLNASNLKFWAQLPKLDVLKKFATFSYDYRIVNWNGYVNPGGTSPSVVYLDDSITLLVSLDCGVSFSAIHAITGNNHVNSNQFKNVKIPVNDLQGNTPIFKIEVAYSNGSGNDYFIDIDNINVYNDTIDLQTTSLQSPMMNGCVQTNDDVIAVIKNNGSIPMTDFFVTAITNSSPFDTFRKNFLGVLAPKATMQINLGRLRTTSNGAMTISTFVESPYDSIYTNDTFVSMNFKTKKVVITALDNKFDVCKFQSINLEGTGSDNYVWYSTVGSSSINPTTFSSLISETVLCVGTDNNGCKDSAYKYITVHSLPIATTKSDSICLGSYGTICAFGASKYNWGALGNTKCVQDNPTTTTIYTVTIEDGHKCTASADAQIYVKELPTPCVTNDSICIGACGTLLAGCGSTYDWGIHGTNPFIQVCVNKTTKIPVVVYGANGCGKLINATIYVRPKTVVTVPPVAVCKGESADLCANGGKYYNWGVYGNQACVNVINPSPGTIPVTVTDGFGCTSIENATVTHKPSPELYVNGGSMCVGGIVNISANNFSTGTSYEWIGLGSGQIKPVSPAVTTSYTVKAKDLLNCTTIKNVIVTVKPKTVISFNPSIPTSACNNLRALNLDAEPVGGVFSGVNVSAATFYPKTAGNGKHMVYYTYSDLNSNGCNAIDSTSITVKTCYANGLNELSINGIKSIDVYPNPFNDKFKIEILMTQSTNLVYNLIDNTGRVVKSLNSKTEIGQNQIEFSTEKFAPGSYILQIVNGDEFYNHSLIKN